MRRTAIFALLGLFACHPDSVEPRAAPDAGPAAGIEAGDSKALLAEVDRLKDQLKDKPKTFEVLAALGNLYYENGRYLDAVDTYRQAEEYAAPAEGLRDLLRSKGVKPQAELPADCRRAGSDYGLSQITDAARTMDPPKALRCVEAALDQELTVRSRRGDAFYLIGNAGSALQEHRGVLAVSPDYPESLFFVGAILLEQSQGNKAQLEEGKKMWSRLLVVAPDHPRAPLVRDALPKAETIFAKKENTGPMPPGHPAVAGNDLPPGHPPMPASAGPMAHAGPTAEEVANVADAVQGTERTPELEKGLDDLLVQGEAALDKGDYQAARESIVRVMPMRPNDPRTAADMGAVQRGLGRTEMAQRVLGRALQLDPKQPRALYEQGKLLAAQGDSAGARKSFEAVQQADAKFAQAHDVAAELGKLK
ncbi:MAG TPA: tetratricopeptide repeat protein [Myxococcales bacterium]|nr:tetratricopeptide repeat protein [Myxococcales bacterium]